MLCAEKLTFSYLQQDPVIADFNMTLQPGEVVGLKGPSGRGKSTLGQLLSGYLQPSEGTIRVDNEQLPSSGYCPVQLIFQHPEQAVNPRWKIGKILREANLGFDRFFGLFGLEQDWLDRYPHELSGGELQRIALLRIMNGRTRYIIADEITSSLDPINQARIWNILLPWAKESGVGLLVISHDTMLLERITGRCVELLSTVETSMQ